MVDACSHLWIRNYNFCNSSVDAIHVRESEYCRFEQLCAWGAASQNIPENSTNYNAFGIHNSHHCHIVDCAFWGTGRKTVCAATNGDDLVWDRCWARYDEPFDEANDIHKGQTRTTWAVCYNNSRNLYFDCLGGATKATGDKGFFRAVFSVDHQDDGSDPQTWLYRCVALSDLRVKAFSNGTQEPNVTPPTGIIPGVRFIDCQDGCLNGHCDAEIIAQAYRRWMASPMLGRIKSLAGADVLADLAALHPTPASIIHCPTSSLVLEAGEKG
jgi:hypothetical protein